MNVDYAGLYEKCVVMSDPNRSLILDTVSAIAITNKDLYSQVEKKTKVPWPIIAAIHFRESGQNFSTHLHNGDPLTARTLHAPMGRPLAGSPPFTWDESACDVFTGFWRPKAWDIGGCLQFMERYNGMGYQRRGVMTPYLWDYTSVYISGLFTADGEFDADAREDRPGTVSILKTLFLKGVSLDFSALSPTNLMLH